MTGICRQLQKACCSVPRTRNVRCLQVEAWVVRAVGRKLLEGKMDQPGRKLLISRATHATFGQSEWDRLQQQLAAWKESMGAVVQMAAQHKAAAPRGLPVKA